MEDRKKIHELSKAWPKLSKERRANLKQSIKEVGLIVPLVVWEDEKGNEWCIDGDHRQEVVCELHDAGIEKADNGHAIALRWVKFKGSELQALEYVKALNGADRRHMRPSQLAMVDVRNYRLEVKYAKRAGVDLEVEGGEGELATLRSERGGYNRTYWFQCNKLANEASDLADKVADGEMSIPQALSELRQRQGGSAGNGEDGEPEKDGDEVRDGLRNVITEPPWLKIFSDRPRFKQARKFIRQAIDAVEELAENPSGKFLAREDDLVATLKSCADVIDKAMPHCVCPACEGSKKGEDNGKCPVCDGKGFVHKGGWKAVPESYKVAGAVGD